VDNLGRKPRAGSRRAPTLWTLTTAAGIAAILAMTPLVARQAKPGGLPVIVVDTVKGVIEVELFQVEAPKSVEHVLALVRRDFYRGHRIHRVTTQYVQFGDPNSRDMSRRDYWGKAGSGVPVGVFESSKKRLHVRGAVGYAHSGDPRSADSQIYFVKSAAPGLDGKHAVIGHVVSGLAVVDKLQETDMVKSVSIKGAGPK
jgi:cyclophilin family peptidyl-prolyl cis-trans isomerase